MKIGLPLKRLGLCRGCCHGLVIEKSASKYAQDIEASGVLGVAMNLEEQEAIEALKYQESPALVKFFSLFAKALGWIVVGILIAIGQFIGLWILKGL